MNQAEFGAELLSNQCVDGVKVYLMLYKTLLLELPSGKERFFDPIVYNALWLIASMRNCLGSIYVKELESFHSASLQPLLCLHHG